MFYEHYMEFQSKNIFQYIHWHRKETSNCKQGRLALVCISMKYVLTGISRRCNTSPEALRDIVRIFTKQVATARRSNTQRQGQGMKKKERAHAFDQLTSTIRNIQRRKRNEETYQI